jgi:arsenate reductase
MALKLYGITNCDTVKKARAWLDARGIAYEFHDYKKRGVDRPELERWVAEHGWEAVLNRAGTTFRKLDPNHTRSLDARSATALMVEHPSAIKRPVAVVDRRVLLGFKPEAYGEAFDAKG